MPIWNREAIVNRDRLLSIAVGYTGYTAAPGRINMFGKAFSMDGLPWDGLFLDHILHEADIQGVPALVYPPAALAEFARTRKFRTSAPRQGDIAFFAYASDGQFDQPHVGIVSDTSDYGRTGAIKVIEGMTRAGQARGNQLANGVYERIRFQADLIGYGRIDYRTRKIATGTSAAGPVDISTIHFSNLTQLHNGRHPDIEAVQHALADAVGAQNLVRGRWDAQTAAEFAAWQRTLGFVSPDGAPDRLALERLSVGYGHFTLAD